MKVIIKYKTTRKKLDVPDNLSVQDLLVKAQELHDASGNLTLSLYKKEISRAKKIKDLELVNGDMLELIEDKNKNAGDQLTERLLGLKKYDSEDEFKEALLHHGCVVDVDFLFLAVHAVMMDLGFRIKSSSTQKPLDSLPDDWKNAAGFYKVRYIYKNKTNVAVECTGSVTGKFMSISGVLVMEDFLQSTDEAMETDSDDDDEPRNIRMKITDCINGTVDYCYNPKQIYKNMKEIDKKIRNDFGLKFVEDIEGKQPTLLSLPSEVVEHIFKNLKVKDLGRVARVSKKANKATDSEELWKHFLYKELDMHDPENQSCKEAVKRLYILREKHEKENEELVKKETESKQTTQQLHRAQNKTPRYPEYDPNYYHQGVYPVTSMPVRGIIGGTRDLYPHVRAQPGDFRGLGIHGHGGPDLIPGRPLRVPMSARYDPMGPLPDDDFRPSRRNIHPDLMGRPGFEPYYDGGFM